MAPSWRRANVSTTLNQVLNVSLNQKLLARSEEVNKDVKFGFTPFLYVI